MKKCLHSHKSIISRWINLVSFLIMGIVLELIALYAMVKPENNSLDIVMCSVLFGVGVGLCIYGVLYQVVQSREYMCDTNGITIRYLKIICKSFQWDDISDISVCDINHAPKDSSVFDLVIRIVIGREKARKIGEISHTLAGYECWRTFWYNIIRFHRIIIIDYSDEDLRSIAKVSRKRIRDLRSNRIKSHPGGINVEQWLLFDE